MNHAYSSYNVAALMLRLPTCCAASCHRQLQASHRLQFPLLHPASHNQWPGCPAAARCPQPAITGLLCPTSREGLPCCSEISGSGHAASMVHQPGGGHNPHRPTLAGRRQPERVAAPFSDTVIHLGCALGALAAMQQTTQTHMQWLGGTGSTAWLPWLPRGQHHRWPPGGPPLSTNCHSSFLSLSFILFILAAASASRARG